MLWLTYFIDSNLYISDRLMRNNKRSVIMDIDEKTYAEIAKMIHSDDSPVGIDAKKTHIYIIYKLTQIEKRLEALEREKSKI